MAEKCAQMNRDLDAELVLQARQDPEASTPINASGASVNGKATAPTKDEEELVL
jgi:hypothetical protein